MSKVAILSYHKIGPPPPPPKGWESWYYVSAEGFERDLRWLADRGYRFISRDDLLAAFDGGATALPEKAALITFDDGYRNNATIAMPIMQRLGVPGVVFVPTGYVSGINGWDIGHEPEEDICTWEDLHELEENGIAIESHSVSHPTFSDLTDEQHELQLRESKSILEDHLGHAIELLAYPYGDAGKEAATSAELLQRVGYRAACLYGGGAVQLPGANRWRLERLAMGPDSKLAEMLGGIVTLMEVLCIQSDIEWEQKQRNCARVIEMITAARPAAGALVVLPEMFASGFSMNVTATADDDGDVRQSLARVARALNIYLLAGIVLRRAGDGAPQNCAVVYDPAGQVVAQYAKCFPFRLGGECDQYTAGDEVVTFDWHGATVAPLICYDLRFPEIFRRATLAHGAEILTVIASWPLPRDQHWLTLLRARAIENQAYVIGVNRSGTDPKFTYFGRSLIVDPKGEVLADAGRDAGIIRAEIDPNFVRQWRRDFPALGDARPDFLK